MDGDGVSKQYSLVDFLSLDLKGKVIVSMRLPKYSTSDIFIWSYKTSHRFQVTVLGAVHINDNNN